MAEVIANVENVEDVIGKLEWIENKIKFQAFGKCSIKKKTTVGDNKLQTPINATNQLEEQTRRVDKEIVKLKETGQSKANQIFKIAKFASGKGASKANAVRHPISGKLIVSQEEISEVSIEFCQTVLEKNEPNEAYKDMVAMKEEIHKSRMINDLDTGFKADKDVFKTVLEKLKKKNIKRSYDFLLKGSDKYKDTIFSLIRMIIEGEAIPTGFRDRNLHQIWKKKPGTKKEDLNANRYIHCKEWLPRTVEAMTVREMDPKIQKATSIIQIGGKPGHRPQEHIFSVKLIIARNIMQKKIIILVCYDISGFFDKEVLSDVMSELYSIGVDPRAYRLLHGLIESTRVRVRTGCSYSELGKVGDILGQGSGGPLRSAPSTS